MVQYSFSLFVVLTEQFVSLMNYPLSTTNKEKEYCTIQQILHKNKFQTHHLDNIVPKMNAESHTQQADETHNTRKPVK